MKKPERPMVLHTRVVTSVGGGPEKTILNSPRFLGPLGFDSVCAYLHPPRDAGFEELRERADDVGARLVGIPDRGPFDFGVVRSLLELCRRENVTIWHGHDYKSNALGLLVRRWWPMKLVSTVHGWVSRSVRTRLYGTIDRLCLRWYDRVACVSPDLVERCLNAGVSPIALRLIENAIDLASCERSRSRAEAKAAFGVPADRLVIGAVGRLAPEKAFDDLVRAVDQLLSAGLDVQLLIAGEGDERRRLEALIDEIGRGDRIRLLGHLQPPQPLYEAMDVYALSSEREGLPNVVLEAMGNRVPVVATRVAGIPRILEDGENGVIVEPRRPEQLSAALERVLRDASLQSRIGEAGHRTIVERYTFEMRMQHIAEMYHGLWSRNGRLNHRVSETSERER